MQLGNFYIWTHSYSVMRRSAKLYKAKCKKHHARTDTSKEHLGQDATDDYVAFVPPTSEKFSDDVGNSVSEIFHCPKEISDVQNKLQLFFQCGPD